MIGELNEQVESLKKARADDRDILETEIREVSRENQSQIESQKNDWTNGKKA